VPARQTKGKGEKTMKKILTLILLGCTMGIASADVAFILNPAITGSSIGGAALGASSTITTQADGIDLLYSFTYANVDLDGGGLANDTLTFDVRWEFFEGSLRPGGSQISLGTATNGAVDTFTGWEALDGVWNRDTLKFTVENVSLTADAGYTASFEGFNRMWVTLGTTYYVGEGADTTLYTMAANGNLFFDRTETLLLTPYASERNRSLGGDFTIIPEPATLGLISAVGGGLLFIRRRRIL
jgi:hypothetical protein